MTIDNEAEFFGLDLAPAGLPDRTAMFVANRSDSLEGLLQDDRLSFDTHGPSAMPQWLVANSNTTQNVTIEGLCALMNQVKGE